MMDQRPEIYRQPNSKALFSSGKGKTPMLMTRVPIPEGEAAWIPVSASERLWCCLSYLENQIESLGAFLSSSHCTLPYPFPLRFNHLFQTWLLCIHNCGVCHFLSSAPQQLGWRLIRWPCRGTAGQALPCANISHHWGSTYQGSQKEGIVGKHF